MLLLFNSLLPVTGSVSATLGALSTSSTGALALSGSTAATLGSLTASSTGALAIAGSTSSTLGTLTLNTVPAIVYQTAGTPGSGTTSLTLAYPAVVASEDLLIAAIVSKHPPNAPATPAGWTLPTNGQTSGGSGASGVDTGSVNVTIFVKEADGTETGSLAISIPSGNSAYGQLHRLSKAATQNWSYACASGANNTPGTAWSVTAGSNPGIAANDLIFTVSGSNTDAYTYSAQAITATGVTFAATSERRDTGSSTGNDLQFISTTTVVTAGTATAAPVFTMTASGTATDNPAGATVLFRARQVEKTFNAGALSVTLGALTNTSTAALALSGTCTATLGAATLASLGTVSLTGTLSQTLGALALDALIQKDQRADLNVTLGALRLESLIAFDTFGALTAQLGHLSLASTIILTPAPSRARTTHIGGIERTAVRAVSRRANIVRRPHDR